MKEENKIIKVACAGDSITYGVGVTNRATDSYPAQLSMLLGEGYEVENFGRSNAYMINNKNVAFTYASDRSVAYTSSAEYTESLEYEPDIVVIMLGANDAYVAASNQNTKQKFMSEAQALYDSYAALASKPKVYFVLCTDRYDSETRRSSLINVILPGITKVAEDNGCGLIDVFSVTNGHANKDSGWYYDSVHPSSIGYAAIAETVYDALT